jgi:hypothetical protein
LRALTEQLPRPVALAGAFEVPTGGTALRALPQVSAKGPLKAYRGTIHKTKVPPTAL